MRVFYEGTYEKTYNREVLTAARFISRKVFRYPELWYFCTQTIEPTNALIELLGFGEARSLFLYYNLAYAVDDAVNGRLWFSLRRPKDLVFRQNMKECLVDLRTKRSTHVEWPDNNKLVKVTNTNYKTVRKQWDAAAKKLAKK